VLNGTMTTVFDHGDVLSRTTQTVGIDNLTLASESNGWPGPGTVIVDNQGSTTSASRITAVYNGTKCVALSIDWGTYTQTRTLDLSSPATAGCTP
jgi:hypothetical protein